MNVAEARQRAVDAIAYMQSMNATSEHPPSRSAASLASVVLDLCSQVDALQSQLDARPAQELTLSETTALFAPPQTGLEHPNLDADA